MTLQEIKQAVGAGKRVHWSNVGYVVTCDRLGQYLITFKKNGSAIGLTNRDGTRLNGKQMSFSLWAARRLCNEVF
jgi:hypothetical protein